MANFTFETMTNDDADAFTGGDRLIFLSGAPGTVSVTHTAAITSGPRTAPETITITSGTKSHTFDADALHTAADAQNLIFVSGNHDTLGFGTDGAQIANLNAVGYDADPADGFNVDANPHTVYYAFGGADSIVGGGSSDWIDGGAGNDTIAGANNGDADSLKFKNDVLQGGAGDDSITGSVGNDHIYGNTQTSALGTADGNDVIHAGAGQDYVNGNAGNDSIFGEAGNDRLFGGAGADTIDGGDGADTINGNKGDDSILGGLGNDSIHGGADNDVIKGDDGDDWLFGDKGADTLTGGAGYDNFTGGEGKDVFVIAAGDNNTSDITNSTGHNNTDVITDFSFADDHIQLTNVIDKVLLDKTGAIAPNVDSALNSAIGILSTSGDDHGVVAIQVGNDTYLFYNGAGTAATVDSAVKLAGIHATDVTTDWFTH